MWMTHNARWLVIGTCVVMGLYLISGATFWLVASQFWPSGPPVEIAKFGFRTAAVEAGGQGSVHVEFDKQRSCQPGARLVFIDAEGEERQFLFAEWPHLAVGEHIVNVAMDVPKLRPGKYTAQVRIIYDCQDGDYLVESPPDDVEIVAAPK